MANVRYRSRTVAIEVCFFFYFVIVYDFNEFPFSPGKAQF